MDIIEKSKEYAKGKAIDALTAAIEQAYVDGYNDCLKHFENERLESFVDGVEYVDLMLPSGTKWATDYIISDQRKFRKFSYVEANKFNLPTKEDFEELCRECRIDIHPNDLTDRIRITGKNGKKIEFLVKALDEENKSVGFPHFWLKNEGEDIEKEYALIDESKKISCPKTFMGYKLPVLLVLKNNNSE